jgi:hypothetical protein
MQSQVLFPLHEDLTPDPARTEPSVWICRLYILGEPNIDSLIREVRFERGLNIIRTEERGDLKESVVAHSVGKTLLMRLIRHTLGEPRSTKTPSTSSQVCSGANATGRIRNCASSTRAHRIAGKRPLILESHTAAKRLLSNK